MANVHRVGDYGGGPNARPMPGVGPMGSSSQAQGQPQRQGPRMQIMGVGDDDDWDGGVFPPISKILMPGFNTYTFIFIVSCLQIFYFIVELVVGGFVCNHRKDDFPGWGLSQGAFAKNNVMAGPSSPTLWLLGAKYLPSIQKGAVYRLVTPIFMHGGITHIFFNMVFQWMFCFRYEKAWGIKRTIFFYFMTGIGASLLSSCTSPCGTSVGASGALFGMLGCQISYLIMNWGTVGEQNARMQMCNLMCIILMNFMLSMGGGAMGDAAEKSIDNWAHFGGLLSGIFLGMGYVVSTATFTSERWEGMESQFKQFGFYLSILWFGILTACIFWVVDLAECPYPAAIPTFEAMCHIEP